MSGKKDPKFTYAQSSDIKSRTYLEYRKDMKKKAIVELEIMNWIENKVKGLLGKTDIIVEKSGGDKFLWFLRSGKITTEPDFVVKTQKGENIFFIEFQYGNREDLEYFDFKISKVSKKKKKSNIREPYKDRIFLCVLKNSLRYTFITPKWIVENGRIDVVPAWGSRQAYRVPREKFERVLQRDDTLKFYIDIIDAKIKILNFQFELISIWENELSKELQRVIDEKKLIKIVPETLEGFFKVCFILYHLNKVPENVNLWLVYLLSYLNKKLTLKEIAMLVYSLDYLYSKIPPNGLRDNELSELERKLEYIVDYVNSFYKPNEGLYRSSINEKPLEETRYALFSINLIEDIIQDAIYYHKSDLKPIKKVYEKIGDTEKILKIARLLPKTS